MMLLQAELANVFRVGVFVQQVIGEGELVRRRDGERPIGTACIDY